jgi:hypothetical protein
MGWKVAVYTNPPSIKVRYRWKKLIAESTVLFIQSSLCNYAAVPLSGDIKKVAGLEFDGER